ncbi:Glycosyltransferase [Beggiatoa sp. PS]|nr:Glycosyltransferase [Beggiatoa sp. PS]
MNNLPLVSVLMVTYNQKHFIKEAIESILTQDYDNLEIVISDDGSNDGTQEILREYKTKYPNKFILVLAEKNQGITKNCNSGLSFCKGKYIAFLAGDDLMLSGKIRKQVEYMERHPKCAICYHNLEVFDSDVNQFLRYFNDKYNPAHEGNVSVTIKYGTFNCASSNMVKKEQIPLHGFDERILMASDWLFWIETLLNGGEIHYIDEVLGKYRKHSNNVTAKKISRNYADQIKTSLIVLIKHPKYFKEVIFRYYFALKYLITTKIFDYFRRC